MLYAVGQFYIIDGSVEFEGYEKVFYNFHQAIEYAYEQTVASGDSEYFHVEPMPENVVDVGGLGDLIVPLTES